MIMARRCHPTVPGTRVRGIVRQIGNLRRNRRRKFPRMFKIRQEVDFDRARTLACQVRILSSSPCNARPEPVGLSCLGYPITPLRRGSLLFNTARSISAFGCDLDGSMQHLGGLGDAITRACLMSTTRLEFRFLAFFHSCLYNIRSRLRRATGKPWASNPFL